MKENVLAEPAQVERHYNSARGKEHFLPIVSYLSYQTTTVFLFEGDEEITNTAKRNGQTFQEYFRKQYTGPFDVSKTTGEHIRNIAVTHNLGTVVDVANVMGIESVAKNDGYTKVNDNLIYCSDSPRAAFEEFNNWF